MASTQAQQTEELNFRVLKPLQDKPDVSQRYLAAQLGISQQTRSFCFVDDLVEGFVRFMDLPSGGSNGEPAVHGPINLGNWDKFTIRSLAEKVVSLTNSPSKLIYLPLPPDDPTQRRPDISHAADELQLQPKVQLEKELNKTIEYFDLFSALEPLRAAHAQVEWPLG